MSSGKFITIREAAAEAGVTPVTMRRRISRVGVPLVRSPHDRRLLLIAAADLTSLLHVEAAIARKEIAA
jgi:hypothetical protein